MISSEQYQTTKQDVTSNAKISDGQGKAMCMALNQLITAAKDKGRGSYGLNNNEQGHHAKP